MYAEYGYEATNEFFCSLLGIEDFVLLNSFDNVFIQAITASGKVIADEGDIVEYANADDPIVDIIYENEPSKWTLNQKAIDAIVQADLIVISTGTFWASIYPTLQYHDLYNAINMSSGKKIWAINNEEDKDAYGVSSNDLIEHFNKLGLDLSQFTILENLDATESLRKENNNYDIVRVSMGNIKGKHDGRLFARNILKIYYGIRNENFDKFIFDFDDTLWARDALDNPVSMKYSRNNIQLLSNLTNKACIVSGNSYNSIARKLSKIYGSSLQGFNIDIWADANSCLFRNNTRVDVVADLMITEDIDPLVGFLYQQYGLACTPNDFKFTTCLKIKPLTELDRKLLVDFLNNYLLVAANLPNCVAIPTGKTTVDIVSRNNSKVAILQKIDVTPDRILYIGDELDAGNDEQIGHLCAHSIHTQGVAETNAILKLLQEN